MGDDGLDVTQATIQALVNQLPKDEDDIDVEGVVDGILVVTDPEISEEDYTEVIENAQDIISETPEGELPFMEDYLGYYLQTCPVCGNTFVTKNILRQGDVCPVCLDEPDNFVMVGKIQADEERRDELNPKEVEETDEIQDDVPNFDENVEDTDEETVESDEEI